MANQPIADEDEQEAALKAHNPEAGTSSDLVVDEEDEGSESDDEFTTMYKDQMQRSEELDEIERRAEATVVTPCSEYLYPLIAKLWCKFARIALGRARGGEWTDLPTYEELRRWMTSLYNATTKRKDHVGMKEKKDRRYHYSTVYSILTDARLERTVGTEDRSRTQALPPQSEQILAQTCADDPDFNAPVQADGSFSLKDAMVIAYAFDARIQRLREFPLQGRPQYHSLLRSKAVHLATHLAGLRPSSTAINDRWKAAKKDVAIWKIKNIQLQLERIPTAEGDEENMAPAPLGDLNKLYIGGDITIRFLKGITGSDAHVNWSITMDWEGSHATSLGAALFLILWERRLFVEKDWRKLLKEGIFKLVAGADEFPVLCEIDQKGTFVTDKSIAASAVNITLKNVAADAGFDPRNVSIKANRKGMAKQSEAVVDRTFTRKVLQHGEGSRSTGTYVGRDNRQNNMAAVWTGDKDSIARAAPDTFRARLAIPRLSRTDTDDARKNDEQLLTLKKRKAEATCEDELKTLEKARKKRVTEIRQEQSASTLRDFVANERQIARDGPNTFVAKEVTVENDTRSLNEYLRYE
ncbi:hypothetical protein HK097_001958 [Rhizophlyctis rosea]|uniref:Uncharacterized protein n=1 Tax=Rhizophlyctis rosea TaxID=64517 RepID=A0AAD5WYN8_9FUNG|nr:hypothetical protein HK097_001958 [Rhizophlyctis rosea]